MYALVSSLVPKLSTWNSIDTEHLKFSFAKSIPTWVMFIRDNPAGLGVSWERNMSPEALGGGAFKLEIRDRSEEI